MRFSYKNEQKNKIKWKKHYKLDKVVEIAGNLNIQEMKETLQSKTEDLTG